MRDVLWLFIIVAGVLIVAFGIVYGIAWLADKFMSWWKGE